MKFLTSCHESRSKKLTYNRFFDRFDIIKGNLACMKMNIEVIKLLLLGFGCTRIKSYRNR